MMAIKLEEQSRQTAKLLEMFSGLMVNTQAGKEGSSTDKSEPSSGNGLGFFK